MESKMEYKMDQYGTMEVNVVKVDDQYELIYKTQATRFRCDECLTNIPQGCRCKEYDYTYNFYDSFSFVRGPEKEMMDLFQIIVEQKDKLVALNRVQLLRWLKTYPGYEVCEEW